MANLKNINEFVTAGFSILAQGFVSFEDGFQAGQDLPQFIDELLLLPEAFKDLNLAGEELRQADLASIKAMFDTETKRLVTAGVNEIVAGLISNSVMTILLTVAVIKRGGGEVVDSKKAAAFRAKIEAANR